MSEIDASMRRFVGARAELIHSAVPGVAAARELSDLTDEAVRGLSRAASSRIDGRWSLFALGGWGSGALLPSSDLDLLVLSEQPESRLKPFVEAVLYPLWDAGLKVGHQVRSPKQQRAAMREDMKTCTAALTARVLAGDEAWAVDALRGWLADTSGRSRRVLAWLDARPRPGSPYLLEPELKECAGGRRDFDELTWRAAVTLCAPARDCEGLVRAGLLSAEEYRVALESAETVAAARWELQRDGYGDRMVLEAAAELTSVASEAVQTALAETALILERVRARSADRRSRDTGAGWLTGYGDIPDACLSAADVFALLDHGEAALPELELAAQAGRLEALLPRMRRLMSVRRPGLGHELTVGAHSLRAAALVATLPDDSPLGRSLASTDRRLVQVAALAHDVGKLEGGAHHAERGAPLAREAATRFGLGDSLARDVAEVVALHLVLVETALRDDLDDEDAVLRCAARVARRELVAPLHALTAVDSMATGAATWTPWTAALVASLVARLDTALSDDADGAGLASRGEAVRAATLSAIPASHGPERAFVESASLRYLATRSPERITRDAALVTSLTPGSPARIAVSAGPAEKTHTVTVAAADRPQLLARLAGAMALAGLDILSVDAFGAPSGTALDEFVVASATAREVTEETFSAVERFVNAALRDRLELVTRLAERRRHYPTRASVEPTIKFESAGWDTVVRVTAADRPGLLHDLAMAIATSGLDIRWAKVQTIDGVARDAFHVVGPDGGPVDDDGALGHLAMRVRELG